MLEVYVRSSLKNHITVLKSCEKSVFGMFVINDEVHFKKSSQVVGKGRTA